MNLFYLTSSQLVAVTGSVLIVTIGGLVGAELAPDPALATLPVSVLVLGTALATVFAAMLMRRIGRRRGFAFGALLASAACFLGAYALVAGSFALFCVAIAAYGANNAFVQQYRFAAAESVDPASAPRAISYVLLGSVGGAVLGPLLATHGADFDPANPYLGSMIAVACLQLVALLALLRLREPVPIATAAGEEGRDRAFVTLVTQPAFVVAVLGGVVGYGVMNLVMTATPLSMHVQHGHSLSETAWVIQSHVLAMYLPSFFSGALIARFGAPRVMLAGAAAMAAMMAAGLQGHAVMHYWWSLVLLGVGWNFLFVGGTALLMESYRPAERFTAQAVNEFSVFGVSALGSLLAGALIHRYGWETVLWSTGPALALVLASLAWLRKKAWRAA